MKKKDPLEAFLDQQSQERKISRCSTCRHKDVAKFDKAFKAFLKRCKEKNQCVSWEVYITKYASTPASGISYPYSYKSAQRHAENCLGLKKDQP